MEAIGQTEWREGEEEREGERHRGDSEEGGRGKGVSEEEGNALSVLTYFN